MRSHEIALLPVHLCRYTIYKDLVDHIIGVGVPGRSLKGSGPMDLTNMWKSFIKKKHTCCKGKKFQLVGQPTAWPLERSLLIDLATQDITAHKPAPLPRREADVTTEKLQGEVSRLQQQMNKMQQQMNKMQQQMKNKMQQQMSEDEDGDEDEGEDEDDDEGEDEGEDEDEYSRVVSGGDSIRLAFGQGDEGDDEEVKMGFRVVKS